MKKSKKIQSLFNSQELDGDYFSGLVIKTFNASHVTTTIYDQDKPDDLMRMFINPNHPPAILEIDFSLGKEKSICLLGKGVLYDSGGYNIKTRGMEAMYSDKFGALIAITIASILKLPVKAFFGVNLIGTNAILPGTIITSSEGKNVRIVDTDAEGRIGLAHLIELANSYKKLVTFATLTGHSAWNVGAGHAEVFDNDHILEGDLGVIGRGIIFEDYKKGLYTHKILDNYNEAYSKAGAAKAYMFLREFLSNNQTLTHFDIAGLEAKHNIDYRYGLEDMINIVQAIQEVK